MDVLSKSPVRSSQISAVIIRADGTREELGVVSYWHRNILKRAWFNIKKFLGFRVS